ncbi:PIR protein [Plasmodium sp.]|nr:PIR protein [Plasmodium sp.]
MHIIIIFLLIYMILILPIYLMEGKIIIFYSSVVSYLFLYLYYFMIKIITN